MTGTVGEDRRRWPVRRVVCFLAVMVALVAGPTGPGARPVSAGPAGAPPAAGEARERLVVTVPAGVAPARAEAIVRAHEGAVIERVDRLHAITVEVTSEGARHLAAALLTSGTADRVAPEIRFHASGHVVPDDGRYGEQWALPRIGAPTAWDETVGLPGTVVAVLDSGIDPTHPDLAPVLLDGYDFVDDDPVPEDRFGHGTHVAGVAAAVGNDGHGIAGVCWRCRILPIKVLGDAGSGGELDVAEGIVGAVDRGADVLVLSFGGPHASPAVASAVDYATSRGAVVVAAAGNSGSTTPAYPAAFPDVIGVASTDEADAVTTWSARGSWVDLAAPGCALGPTLGGGSAERCGTSVSAPLVAGAAALLMSRATDAGAEAIASVLAETAVPIGDAVAHGRVDVGSAMPHLERQRACPDPAHRPFLDVSPDGVHAPGVTCLADLGVGHGRTAVEYVPADLLRRDQMASVLARSLEVVGVDLPDAQDAFRDDDGSLHEPAIDLIAAMGIASGSSPGRFEPGRAVTRGHAASFVARTFEAVTGEMLPAGGDAFVDDAGSVHEDAINRAAAAGLVSGVGEARYGPGDPIRRDQTASIVSRLLDLLVAARPSARPSSPG